MIIRRGRLKDSFHVNFFDIFFANIVSQIQTVNN